MTPLFVTCRAPPWFAVFELIVKFMMFTWDVAVLTDIALPISDDVIDFIVELVMFKIELSFTLTSEFNPAFTFDIKKFEIIKPIEDILLIIWL